MSLLATQIWQCLNLDLNSSAEFLAEQLVANEDNEDSRFLLGYVQLKLQQPLSAMKTVEPYLYKADCLYVYAKACLDLNEATKGIDALKKHTELWFIQDNDSMLPSVFAPNLLSPSVFFLLYADLQRQIDEEASTEYYHTSVKLNPYLISNVMALAKSTMVSLDPEKLFTRFADPFSYSEIHDISLPSNFTPAADTRGSNAPSHAPGPTVEESNLPKLGISKAATSTPRRIETPRRVFTTPLNTRNAQASPINTSSINNIGNTLGISGPGIFQTPSNLQKQLPLMTQRMNKRRDRVHSLSMMLSDQSSLSSLGKNVLAHFEEFSSHTQNLDGEGVRGVAGITLIFQLLNDMSTGGFKIALQGLDLLAESVRKTPFVLALTGRLLLELTEYEKCIEKYMALRELQPDRCRDMEYLSTALWHAKKESDLAKLAYELSMKGSPSRKQWQSWCVMGNSFSLKNDSHNAIKCFQRATMINPKSAYAHTLMGYEYCSNEELETGEACFKRALQQDPNLYNAWYGLGTVSYSMGDYEQAELLFTQAINLNPSNPVLLCFVGTVYEALGNNAKALVCFQEASNESPNSPIPRFRKAEAYINAGRYKDALDELLALESLVPEDSSVHLAMAKAYQGLGHNELAVQKMTIAQNLAPKSSTSLRKVLESM